MMQSILFERNADRVLNKEAPGCFRDLNLDRILGAAAGTRRDYPLRSFFETPLLEEDEIRYRQEIVKELRQPPVAAAVDAFADGMRRMRDELFNEKEFYYKEQKQHCRLLAALHYCEAAESLYKSLCKETPVSRGFQWLLSLLDEYLAGEVFQTLKNDAVAADGAIRAVHYCVKLNFSSITISPYEGQRDYSAQVDRFFEKFKTRQSKDYLCTFEEPPRMNHVEYNMLALAKKRFPEPFSLLESFCAAHTEFPDAALSRFDTEVQFYRAAAAFTAPIEAEGLSFCFPAVSAVDRTERVERCFDLALAMDAPERVVTNGYHLEGVERIMVVTGPNQGGKTTFARTVGQMHYLASLGLMVPASSAELFLQDRILTHFEREEQPQNQSGKLEDDLLRAHAMFAEATGRSLFIFNEIFSSTTLEDALTLSKKLTEKLYTLDCPAVFVTFLDELSDFGEKTVSMMSTVEEQGEGVRTFKVIRRKADGLAYAMGLAKAHGLTFQQIKERIGR